MRPVYALLFILVVLLPSAAADPVSSLLQSVATSVSNKFNISVSVAYTSGDAVQTAAAGFTDAGLGMGVPTRHALVGDRYVWGSTTKMVTAASVMQLIDKGIVSLDDMASTHIDPLLLRINGTKLSDHFGEGIDKVKVRHLLHMTSGLSDYDGSSYTKAQFNNRTHDFSPIEILSHFVKPLSSHSDPPGTRQRYCSTNYILLGLLLTNHLGPKTGSWQDYDQSQVWKGWSTSVFPLSGPCQDYTPVHGFMEGYEGASWLKPQDVINVSCLGGWTAGNYVGPASDVARFTRELYRPGGTIISKARQAEMIDFSVASSRKSFAFYGMGTFNLNFTTGSKAAYGHVGDTYGYQSSATYFADLDGALAVATDAETLSQAQAGDATCKAYKALAAMAKGKEPPKGCAFKVYHRFFGSCECDGLE